MADAEMGGESACWAHLLDEDGRLVEPSTRIVIRVRSVYDRAGPEDGFRALVDRLWPRGLKKESGSVDAWLKDLAPGTELRRWYGHDLERWPEFVRRYRDELAAPEHQDSWENLARWARTGPVTVLCATRDPEHSNAEIVRRALIERLSLPTSP